MKQQVGYTIGVESKKFTTFQDMMEWAANYYESPGDFWEPDKFTCCIDYDVTESGEFVLRGISEWEPAVISQVRFSGRYVAGWEDEEHSEDLRAF